MNCYAMATVKTLPQMGLKKNSHIKNIDLGS